MKKLKAKGVKMVTVDQCFGGSRYRSCAPWRLRSNSSSQQHRQARDPRRDLDLLISPALGHSLFAHCACIRSFAVAPTFLSRLVLDWLTGPPFCCRSDPCLLPHHAHSAPRLRLVAMHFQSLASALLLAGWCGVLRLCGY